EAFLAVLQGLGGLVRNAGPAQLAFGIDQHEPGPIGREQLLGRVGDLLQGRGQPPFGVQGAQGADALGQVSGVDGHSGCLPFWYRTGEPVSRPGRKRAQRMPIGPQAVAWEGPDEGWVRAAATIQVATGWEREQHAQLYACDSRAPTGIAAAPDWR